MDEVLKFANFRRFWNFELVVTRVAVRWQHVVRTLILTRSRNWIQQLAMEALVLRSKSHGADPRRRFSFALLLAPLSPSWSRVRAAEASCVAWSFRPNS